MRVAPGSSEEKPSLMGSLTDGLEPCLTLPSGGRHGSGLTGARISSEKSVWARDNTGIAAPSYAMLRNERGRPSCRKSGAGSENSARDMPQMTACRKADCNSKSPSRTKYYIMC